MSDKTSKKHLIRALADAEGISQARAERMVNVVIEAITTSLRDGKSVAISNVGTLRPVEVSERLARNPQNGETVIAEAVTVVRWRTSPTLIDVLSGRSERSSLSTKAPKGSL